MFGLRISVASQQRARPAPCWSALSAPGSGASFWPPLRSDLFPSYRPGLTASKLPCLPGRSRNSEPPGYVPTFTGPLSQFQPHCHCGRLIESMHADLRACARPRGGSASWWSCGVCPFPLRLAALEGSACGGSHRVPACAFSLFSCQSRPVGLQFGPSPLSPLGAAPLRWGLSLGSGTGCQSTHARV